MTFIIDYFIHLYLKYTHKRIDYSKYLQSRHWEKIRRKALKRAKNRCAVCTNTKNLEVHHSNYQCLYNEHRYDIVVLCKSCHSTFHYYRWKPKKDRKVS